MLTIRASGQRMRVRRCAWYEVVPTYFRKIFTKKQIALESDDVQVGFF